MYYVIISDDGKRLMIKNDPAQICERTFSGENKGKLSEAVKFNWYITAWWCALNYSGVVVKIANNKRG